MIRTEPIIGVADVEKSAEWYQKLFGCKRLHGGPKFEMLADQDDTVILCLHLWGEHEHPTLTSPKKTPGNGLILYFKVDNLDDIWNEAQLLNATIEEAPHLNQNSGKEEFAIRDLDHYYLLISK